MTMMGTIAAAPDLVLSGISGGTPLRTAMGLRRAELVRPGDLLITRDRGLQPVRLVVRISAPGAARGAPDRAALRIEPRALGPMMPSAAVVLGPDQRILVPAYLLRAEVNGPAALIAARALGGSSDAIWCDRTMDDVPMYAICFDRHEVISAAGLWVESFRPDPLGLACVEEVGRERLLERYPCLRDIRDPFPPAPWDTVPDEAYLPAPF